MYIRLIDTHIEDMILSNKITGGTDQEAGSSSAALPSCFVVGQRYRYTIPHRFTQPFPNVHPNQERS